VKSQTTRGKKRIRGRHPPVDKSQTCYVVLLRAGTPQVHMSDIDRSGCSNGDISGNIFGQIQEMAQVAYNTIVIS
jgi:hypothetical protein